MEMDLVLNWKWNNMYEQASITSAKVSMFFVDMFKVSCIHGNPVTILLHSLRFVVGVGITIAPRRASK